MIGLSSVVSLAILVLDVDEIELAGAEMLDADIGVAVGQRSRVDRIFARVVEAVSRPLDEFGRRGISPMRSVEEWRKASIIFRCEPCMRVFDPLVERMLYFVG